jgi:hypothetical protein
MRLTTATSTYCGSEHQLRHSVLGYQWALAPEEPTRPHGAAGLSFFMSRKSCSIRSVYSCE